MPIMRFKQKFAEKKIYVENLDEKFIKIRHTCHVQKFGMLSSKLTVLV